MYRQDTEEPIICEAMFFNHLIFYWNILYGNALNQKYNRDVFIKTSESLFIVKCDILSLGRLYGNVDYVEERHRHRYEVGI